MGDPNGGSTKDVPPYEENGRKDFVEGGTYINLS